MSGTSEPRGDVEELDELCAEYGSIFDEFEELEELCIEYGYDFDDLLVKHVMTSDWAAYQVMASRARMFVRSSWEEEDWAYFRQALNRMFGIDA